MTTFSCHWLPLKCVFLLHSLNHKMNGRYGTVEDGKVRNFSEFQRSREQRNVINPKRPY